MGEPESLWGKETWDGLVDENALVNVSKRDLTYRVEYSHLFMDLRVPLDFHSLVGLGDNKCSELKVPKMLLTSLSEYTGKEKENLDFVDLLQMYESIRSVFLEKEIYSNELKKWRKANGLSRFGISQYGLMDKYIKGKDPRKG